MKPTLGLVGCAAGGLERLRSHLITPALRRGWNVALTVTPTAASWLSEEEIGHIETLTGRPCRVAPRLPGHTSPHPRVDCWLVCPASATTVGKLALGLGDNQALTSVCEAIGVGAVPVVVFPRVNAAHVRHPAWQSHVDTLQRAGVHLLTGQQYWPVHEPRSAPDKDLPWQKILDAVAAVMPHMGQG